jgi:hypothetical protein
MQDTTKRYYRKNLTAHGLIYIAGEEIEMTVRNLSITGLLAELSGSSPIHTIEDLFKAIKESARVDIYLPEMRLMGDANVVRADLVDGHIYLALEFCNISHDVDNALYKRRAYRKPLVANGLIMFNHQRYTFTTQNVSVAGMMIHLREKLDVPENTVTIFDFKQLNLRGEIKVVWIEPAEDGGTLMGLEYVHIGKTEIKGIPNFTTEK